MNTTNIQNDPVEVASFIIRKLLTNGQKYPTIRAGLIQGGLTEEQFNVAWARTAYDVDPVN